MTMNKPRKTPDEARASASYKIEKMLPYAEEDEETIAQGVRELWREKELDKLRAVAIMEAIRHEGIANFWKQLASNLEDMQA